MSASRKKVVVRELGGELHRGYLPASDLATEGSLELLLLDGRAAAVPLADVKYVAYVKDFNSNDAAEPERLGPRTFASKPRGPGLWVELRFEDDDILQGILHAGLPLLDSLLVDRGIFLDPADKRGNTQRLFVPRSALRGFEVLGMAANASPARKPAPPPRGQGDLFGAPTADAG